MTRSAKTAFDWFTPPSGEDWGEWRGAVFAERNGPGAAGRRRQSALECGAWLPQGVGARPLVIVLHGRGQSPDDIDDELGWTRTAQERRFAVMFMRETADDGSASPLWWAPPGDDDCFDWFDLDGARRDSGQPAAVVRALDRLSRAHPDIIDPTEVYIVGFSAGAGMAALLLTAWPDRFAGAGLIAGPAVGVAASAAGAWAVHVSPHLAYRPETVRRWAADLRADACRARDVRADRYRHKVSIWHGEADVVVDRGHSAALVDQFAGMMEIPVTRHWTWFMPPRLEISGQTAGHIRRALIDPLSGRRRNLHRIVFAESGEALIQANRIDGLGHAVPVSPNTGRNGEIIGENDRRKYVGIDSTSEMLDFFGVAPLTAL